MTHRLEVLRVARVREERDDRRTHLLRQQRIPAQAAEESVVLERSHAADLEHRRATASEAFVDVARQQAFEHRVAGRGRKLGEANTPLAD